MIKVVIVEVIDERSACTCGHKGIDVDGFVVEDVDITGSLIGVVSPDYTFLSLRVVGFSDAGEQHHASVVQRIGCDDDQVGRLLKFSASSVRVGNTSGSFFVTVKVDTQNLRFGPQLEMRILQQHRQDDRLRCCLGKVLTGVPLAEPTIVAGVQLQSLGVG